MKMIKRPYITTLPFLFIMFLSVLSCDQDPIFDIIYQEVAPTRPRIEAGPTNRAIFTREVPILYVASGRLHWYAWSESKNETVWDSPEHSIPQPGGKIVDLTATTDYLYVLSLPDSGMEAILRRIGKTGNVWEDVSIAAGDHARNYPLLQAIYADPDSNRLFAGARESSSNSRAVLFLDENDGENGTNLKFLHGDITKLTGLVYDGKDTYLLSTAGSGIYKVIFTASSSFTVEQLRNSDPDSDNDLIFAGMIRLSPSAVIAVERNGAIYQLDDSKFTLQKNSNGDPISLGRLSSGALALWQDKDAPEKSLLLAGITTTSSSYTGGYLEFDLTDTGTLNLNSDRHEPGVVGPNNITSVDNNGRYAASIGKYPINHLFQAPKEIDDKMTLFASTQTTGLWSYRERKGEWQWNAEE